MQIKCLLSMFVVGSLWAARTVQAEQAVAVTPGNGILLFDTATPGNAFTVPVGGFTGLGANETVRGIDYRPATGELIASTVVTGSAANSVIKTYRIDHTTGMATLIGATAAALAGAGDVPTGYDVNPVIDRIRYVNTNEENARFNPNNGTLAGNDTDLTPAATSNIIAAAYDRNTPGTPLTTLYLIDRANSALAVQGGINGTPSPNGGVVTDLCSLGITLHPANDGGFDISPSGTAYAALTNNATGLTGLYRIDPSLGGCNTILIGLIGTGATQIYSLTILPPDTDGDGVRDPLDGCPNDPAKTAAGLCGCGVADVDTDADGTLDCNDGCPADPAKTAPGTCGCGVADVDTDGDGTLDCNDGCPADPAKTAPGTCGCGVADVDTDGDGTLDCNDGCPNDALKITPGVCGCGSPNTDTDTDGTANCNDGCPDDPSKITPGTCGCGVADTDTDADGRSDCVDNCPAAANANQADTDNDGVGDVCEAMNPPPSGQATPACGQQGAACGMGTVGLMPLVFLMVRRMRPTRRRPVD